MLYYEDIKLRRRRRGMYRRETSYIYVLGAKPLDEPLTNTGDTLQRCHNYNQMVPDKSTSSCSSGELAVRDVLNTDLSSI